MKSLILRIAGLIILVAFCISCAKQTIDIKSPCVSESRGPCGPKKPVNDWWLKSTQEKNSA